MTKFWADAKVPVEAVYIGSDPVFKETDPTDFYIQDETLHWVDRVGGYRGGISVEHILASTESNAEWRQKARDLVRAHQSRAAQPAPASRAEMIEKVEKALMGLMVDKSVAEYVVDAIHPELKPLPAPVEPVKTAGQERADARIPLDAIAEANPHLINIRCGEATRSIAAHSSSDGEYGRSLLRKVLAEEVDSALAARDTAHAGELVALRERCAEAATDVLEVQGARDSYLDKPVTAIRAVPLTAAPEARP